MRRGGGTVRRFETVSPDPGRAVAVENFRYRKCIVNDSGRMLVPRRRSRASQPGEEKSGNC